MKKGITAVIATMLLLLITIALIGVAIVFFNRTVQTSSSAVEENLNEQMKQSGVIFSVEEIGEDSIHVRNLGNTEITDLRTYINGKFIYSQPSIILPGQTGEVLFDWRQLLHFSGNVEYKITVGTFQQILFVNRYPIINFAPFTGQQPNGLNINVSTEGANSLFIDVNNSLVLYLSLNNHLLDMSTYGNNGTSIGANCSKKIDGAYGTACKFHGNESIKIPHSDSLNITDAVTVEAWVKHASSIFTNWEPIVTKGDKAYRLHICDNAPSCFNGSTPKAFAFGITGPPGKRDVGSTIIPDAGKWYHVAGTYDGIYQKIYVNGIEAATMYRPGTIQNTNVNNLSIGHNEEKNWRYFNGTIDEVRVWNRALSAEEIMASYRGKKNFFISFDGYPAGTYSYYACATNTEGSISCTETRTK